MRDPYELLGVDRSATQDEIKSAFRRAATVHHPDKNPGDDGAHQRFKEINAAHEILKDPQKRAAFDRFGNASMGGANGPDGPFGGQGMPFDMADLNLDGIFGDLLGALGIKVGDRGTLQKEVKLTFVEAALGCTKEITYDRVELCGDCTGTGSAAGAATERCPVCSGRGRVRFQQGVFPITIERPCSRCVGTGRLVINPCPACRGAGLKSRPRTIVVTISPGIENGAVRPVERGGNATRADRPAGDLELVFRVAPSDFFQRVGDDIVCTCPISFAQAALGGIIEIPTLEGKVGKLTIPAGTQPGTMLKVKGRGIPRGIGGRGDQLVEVKIEIPTQLTPAQRDLIAKLAEDLGEKVQPQQASFMEKLRNLFG